jgi:hypothetical protein
VPNVLRTTPIWERTLSDLCTRLTNAIIGNQAACTFSEAFDVLIDAYQRIGELIPLLSQYESLFQNHPQMSRVLSLMYEDILEFHWKAMQHFKQRSKSCATSMGVSLAKTSSSVAEIISCIVEKL